MRDESCHDVITAEQYTRRIVVAFVWGIAVGAVLTVVSAVAGFMWGALAR